MLTAFAAIQELVKKLFGETGGYERYHKPYSGSSSSGLSLGSEWLGWRGWMGFLDGIRFRGSYTPTQGIDHIFHILEQPFPCKLVCKPKRMCTESSCKNVYVREAALKRRRERGLDWCSWKPRIHWTTSISSGVQTSVLHGQESWGESIAIWHETHHSYSLWYK